MLGSIKPYRAVGAQHQDVQLLYSGRAVGLQPAGLRRALGEMRSDDVPKNARLIHPARSADRTTSRQTRMGVASHGM